MFLGSYAPGPGMSFATLVSSNPGNLLSSLSGLIVFDLNLRGWISWWYWPGPMFNVYGALLTNLLAETPKDDFWRWGWNFFVMIELAVWTS